MEKIVKVERDKTMAIEDEVEKCLQETLRERFKMMKKENRQLLGKTDGTHSGLSKDK